ncbi:MAG: hypothetical protein GY810_19435 [Aureispira sp.]|nr:hypothetical protein [Aureispira sp.]
MLTSEQTQQVIKLAKLARAYVKKAEENESLANDPKTKQYVERIKTIGKLAIKAHRVYQHQLEEKQKEEESSLTHHIGYEDEDRNDEDKKTSLDVSMSSDGGGVDIETKKGTKVNVEYNKEEGLKGEIEQDLGDDYSVALSANAEGIEAAFGRSWEIVDFETPGIPLVFPWLKLKFGFNLEAAIKQKLGGSFKDGTITMGIGGEMTGTGTATLYGDFAIVEVGGDASIIAHAETGGHLEIAKNEPTLSFDGINGSLNMQFGAFVKASEWVCDIWEFCGGSKESLEYRIETREYSLLAFTVPGYSSKEGMTGELGIGMGEDMKEFIKPIEDFVKMLEDALEKASEVIDDIIGAIEEFIGDCARVMEAGAKMYFDPLHAATYLNEMQEDAARDDMYKAAVKSAVEEAKKDPEVFKAIKDVPTKTLRRVILQEYVKKKPLVKKAWEMIYVKKDKEGARGVINQIEVEISSFELKPDKDKFYLGQEVGATLTIKGDRRFPTGNIYVFVRCNGKAVDGRKYNGEVANGEWSKHFMFELPASGYEDSSQAKWEFVARMDIEGETKDKEHIVPIEVKKPKVDPKNKVKSVSVDVAKAAIQFNKKAYTIGNDTPGAGKGAIDVMDVTVVLDRPHHKNYDRIKIDALWLELMYDGKPLSRETQLAYKLTPGVRKNFTFKEMPMPNAEECRAKKLYPSKWGGRWSVRTGVYIEQLGQELVVADQTIQVGIPKRFQNMTREQFSKVYGG